MILSLLSKSLQELYQSFCWKPFNCYCALTYFCVLWLLLLFFYLLVEIPFTLTFWKNEHTQKHHQGRAKRRRKGWRYYQREEEEKKMLLSVLKRFSFVYPGPCRNFVPPVSCSPLGQHHDSTRFRQLLCPDPSCEVCNDATAEMDHLLFSEALHGSTPSVSSLASAAPVTESLSTLSPAFSVVPPGEPIPPPLSEPFPLLLSNLSPNPVTPLSDFASSLPPDHSLPSEPLPPFESKLTVDDSPFQTFAFPSLPPHDTQSSNTFLTLNTIVIDASITQDINPFPDLGLTSNATASVTYHGPPTMSVSPPPHYSLTVTQPKSIHISSKPALENSTPDSTQALSTYVPQGTDHTKLSISHFFCQKACVRDPLLFTLAQDDFNQVQDMGYDSEEDLNTDIMSLSGANSLISGHNIRQRQPENVSRAHLSKKSEEINEGQLPATVHSPWHAIHQTLSGQYRNKIKQTHLALSAGKENCLNTCNELPFLECSEQQKLEAHITKFHLRRMWALLAKVLKSIKIFKLRGTSSHSLSDSKSSSSTNLISERDSKSRSFQPVRGISKTLNQPHPVTSLMGKEGQRTLRQSPLNIARGLAGEVQRIQVALQTLLPVTNSITDKESERHIPRANICPPKLSIRQASDGHGPKNQRVNSSHSKKMKKSEPVSMPNMFRAEELDALQPKMNDILTTSKLGISQRLNVNESKGVTTMTTKSLPGETSVFQDLKSANLQKQLSETKWKLENRKQSQAQGQHTHVSHALDSLSNTASLTQAQGVSSVDKAAHQVLHVPLGNTGVSRKQPREPWVPRNIARSCQDKSFPPIAKKARLTGSTSEELGGGNAGLGTSQPGRERFPTQDLPLKERLGSKSPQTPSQKAQSLPESLFRNQISRFFQWLHPEIKCQEQEYSEEKGSPLSSTQSRGPVESKVDTGSFLEEKLGHVVDISCPQEPLPSAVKTENGQQKAAVCASAEPVQGHPFNCRTSSFKETDTKSDGQEAVLGDKDRLTQKVLAFKDKLFNQKQPQSVPWRRTVPHPSPTCRPAAARGPPALTAAGGVVEINVYYVDSNHLYRISRERRFPTPK
ncbi:unnamed protein product [Pipistrellus nathusii]|uniref:Uncharacterized protein n=1 Tax=Pipistrellus nathusii TaxID=59473 RepID=A0ABN9Z6F8_PIPNA